jgi:hypothetical protein
VLLVLVGLAAYSALTARAHASRALSDFQYVQSHLSSAATRAGRTDLESHLEAALSESQAAKSSLTATVVLGVTQWIPYFGAEIKGASALFADATISASSGLGILHALDTFQASDASGNISNVSLVTLQRKVADATSTIASLDRPVGSLFGPVGRERVAFDKKVAHAVHELTNVSDALSVGRSLLGNGGTSTILVLPENNAEMRDQGAILSYSLLRVHGTSISVVRSGHSYSLNLASPINVPASPGTKAFFYRSGANQIWQSVNSPADFSWTGATAAAIFKKATGITVDDIIALDVPTMAALVGVTGPLTVPGIPEQLTSANFATFVLHDLYAQYAVGSQGPRYADLNSIATVLLQRLRSNRHDQVAYLRVLAGEIPGRHLLLWSADPSVEKAIVHLGASGKVDTVLPTRTFHVAVESAVADKMDYYISLHETYQVTLLSGGGARIDTTVSVRNNAPAGQPPSYQLGPDGINSHVPGEYVSNVFLWSPRGSKVIGSESESGLVLRAYSTVVLAQHTSGVPFSTYLPRAVVAGKFVFHLVPQSTLNPVEVSVQVHGAGWSVSGPTDAPFVLSAPVTLTYSANR